MFQDQCGNANTVTTKSRKTKDCKRSTHHLNGIQQHHITNWMTATGDIASYGCMIDEGGGICSAQSKPSQRKAENRDEIKKTSSREDRKGVKRHGNDIGIRENKLVQAMLEKYKMCVACKFH